MLPIEKTTHTTIMKVTVHKRKIEGKFAQEIVKTTVKNK